MDHKPEWLDVLAELVRVQAFGVEGPGSDLGRVKVCLLLLYVLVTSKVISVRTPTWDRAHSWRLNGAASLGNQAI